MIGLQTPDGNAHQLIADEQNVPHAGIAILSKAAQGRAFDGRVEFAGNELAVDGQVERIASEQVDFRGLGEHEGENILLAERAFELQGNLRAALGKRGVAGLLAHGAVNGERLRQRLCKRNGYKDNKKCEKKYNEAFHILNPLSPAILYRFCISV